MNCFECGSSADLELHHVVPKSRGGTKTVLLCQTCHSLVHAITRTTDHHVLCRAGNKRKRNAQSLEEIQNRWPELYRALEVGLGFQASRDVAGCGSWVVTRARHLWMESGKSPTWPRSRWGDPRKYLEKYKDAADLLVAGNSASSVARMLSLSRTTTNNLVRLLVQTGGLDG